MAVPPPEFSIVLPTHNAADDIAPMVAAMRDVLAPLGRWEIIYVDNGSIDGTLAALRAAAAADPAVRYISFTRNFSHEAALRAGLRFARGKAVIVIDADREQTPGLIPDLVREWRAGFKIVTARRIGDESNAPWFKRVMSRLCCRLRDAIGEVHIEPGSTDDMLMDRVVVDAVNRFEDQELFLRGVVRWLGYPLTSVPIGQSLRPHGDGGHSLRRMVELAVTGIAVQGLPPLRVAIWLALGFAALGAAFIVYSIASLLFVQPMVAGWTSIMAAIAILGAAQLLVLGIIGENVGRILRGSRRRPSYVVAETEARAPRNNIERITQPAE